MRMLGNVSTTIYDCIVIGAGASGLFYAAAEDTSSAGPKNSSGRKLILEKTSRPGQKLLLSGSGACNITHGGSIKDFIGHYGDNGSKIRSCLYKHSNLQLMKFMEDAGVPLTEREDGKVFPASMKAQDVLDGLLAKASRNGFELLCRHEVTGISQNAEIITVTAKSGHAEEAAFQTRKLVIATGGASYPATGSDGSFMDVLARDLDLHITQLKPALAPVYVENYPYSELSGISFPDVEVTCRSNTLRGPMLLTHKGFSGPVMLHISQYVQPGALLTINYLPDQSIADVYRKVKSDQPGNSKGIANYLSREFGLPKAFTQAMFTAPGTGGRDAAARKLSSVGHKELENIVHLLMERRHTVSGTGGFREAMATAGGVCLDEIDMKNMSLIDHPNIHIIGEALDINGDTGGYNLQFAYASALAAR